MELSVYNIKGEDTGKTVVLNDTVFGLEPNDHAIYLDVKQFLANSRQGTHKTKGRSEVTGSTRKLKKQKGTGGARCGDIKAPIFVGGGRVFGPTPRDYSFKLNKKLKSLARKSALSYKAIESAIMVVEDFTFATPRTKDFISMAKSLQVADKKLVLVLPEQNKNVYLSAQNLKKTSIVTVPELNTFKVLDAKCLILTEGSLAIINNL
jgi:large subunit ribosomal protein L4